MCLLSKSHKAFNIIFGKFPLFEEFRGRLHTSKPTWNTDTASPSLFMSDTQRLLAAWRSTPVWAQPEMPCL